MAEYLDANSFATEYMKLYPAQHENETDTYDSYFEKDVNHIYHEIADLSTYLEEKKDISPEYEIKDVIAGGLMLFKAFMRKNETINPTASLIDNSDRQVNERKRWSEMSRVKASCLLNRLSFSSKEVQEALFKCVLEQVAYARSLDLVVQYYVNSPRIRGTLSKRNHQMIFSNFIEMQKLGRAQMDMLGRMWKHSCLLSPSLMMFGLKHFAIHNSLIYKNYACNYGHQIRTLTEERKSNARFHAAVSHIQKEPALHQIGLETVLFLPAVRINFLKSDVLGVLAVLNKADPDYIPVNSCFEELKRMTSEFVEEFKKGVQPVGTLAIEDDFTFPNLQPIPVKTGNGSLVKEGLLLCDMLMIDKVVSKEKVNLYLIAYENTVFITKSTSKTNFEIIAYEGRKKIRIKMIGKTPRLTLAPQDGKWVFYFQCKSEKEQSDWNEAVLFGRSCKCYLCNQKL